MKTMNPIEIQQYPIIKITLSEIISIQVQRPTEFCKSLYKMGRATPKVAARAIKRLMAYETEFF